MSDSRNLLAELRKKVEEAKRKLEEQENALRIVESMLDVSAEEEAGSPAVISAGEQTKQSLTRKRIRVPASTGTIVENVTTVLPDFNGRTYTVSDIYERMQEVGTAPDNKSSISTALRKMAGRKRIEVVVQGKGKAPSVYKGIEEISFM